MIKACLLLVLVLMSLPTWASHQASPVLIDDGLQLNLKGHLSIYRDATGQASVEDVAKPEQDLFSPIKNSLSEGFTSDAIWVSFTLAKKDSGSSVTRWLELTQPLLFNSKLYQKTATGDYIEVRGLLNQRIKQQTSEYKKSIFEIEVLDDHPQSYYLRIHSPSSISSELILWEPGEFVASNTAHRFLWGGVYGAYLLTVIFYFAFGFWTRQRIHLLYAVYVAILFLASFFSGAWPQQFFPNLSTDLFFRMLGTWICLSPLFAIVFFFSYLNLQGNWRLYSHAVIGLVVMGACIALSLVLTDRYRVAAPLMQVCAITVITLAALATIVQSINNDRKATLLLLAFSFFYFGVVIRVLKNFGLVQSNFLTENGYQVGTFIHIMIMSGTVFSMYTAMRTAKRQAEIRLQAEISLRKDQNEFISMISHEFRTPLSIIAASTENLLRGSDVAHETRNRIEKIGRANIRMSAMMEDYLTHERMLDDVASMKLEPQELNQTVEDVLLNFEDLDHSPKFTPCPTPLFIKGDKVMVKIIVQNLLGNALRYTPESSPVVSCRIDGAWAAISVFNEGSGIADKDLPHIFKKYYRGSNAAGTSGTGLGLYLVQSILDRHHGEVSARNVTTGGCEFIVRFPLQTAPSQ
jgi:signal transduction histidine kinase